jgi:hypothetical protein
LPIFAEADTSVDLLFSRQCAGGWVLKNAENAILKQEEMSQREGYLTERPRREERMKDTTTCGVV